MWVTISAESRCKPYRPGYQNTLGIKQPVVNMRGLRPPVQVPECHAHLLRWVEEMASFLKSLDENHLVTVGEEGAHASQLGCDADLRLVTKHGL